VVHTDAAQAIGKIDVDVTDLDVDLLSIAGHKCYAPKGVGALYRRPGTPINPVLLGAGQEHGLRPGTENVAGIVGLGAACDLARTHLTAETKQLACLRHTLWQLLNAAVPGLVRHTPEVALPNTLTVSFPGVLGRDVLAHAAGLAASTGSACHSGQETPSATLLAMGVPPATALGSVRLSLGRTTTGHRHLHGSHDPGHCPRTGLRFVSADLPSPLGKDYADESVFQPGNLLREARRQRNLPDQPVPRVCLLDPDGDIAAHLADSGRGQRHPGGPATTPTCGSPTWTGRPLAWSAALSGPPSPSWSPSRCSPAEPTSSSRSPPPANSSRCPRPVASS